VIVAFIPARGGSKSIPLKNIKPFCEKPLLYWNLLAIENSLKIDEVYVATDSDEIKNAVLSFNFKKTKIYDRDPLNAADASSTESVMMEFLAKKSFKSEDLFILVQATSPLTETKDFDSAIDKYLDSDFDSMLSVVRTKRFYWNHNGEPLNYDFIKRPRRQDFDGLFMENGAFYINRIGNILNSGNRLSGKIGIFEMDDYKGFEIDEPEDWIICEGLMKSKILFQHKMKKSIKLFLTDVDGVLTDAGMYYAENGDELKKFNTHDGMGFKLLRDKGVKTGIITSEDTKIVERRANKLKVDYLYQGVKDKLSCAKIICEKEGITLDEVAYIGDDINDFELLSNVGIAACPENAVPSIKSIPGIMTLNKKGGDGAVREFINLLNNLVEGLRLSC